MILTLSPGKDAEDQIVLIDSDYEQTMKKASGLNRSFSNRQGLSQGNQPH